MRFEVNERKKKASAVRRVTSTLGGKLAVTFTLLSFALALVVPWYLINFTSGLSNDSADGAIPEAVFSAGGFGALAIIGAGATWRQRNRGVSMRTKESLTFDGCLLDYTFHPSADRWSDSFIEAKIDLRETRVAFDQREQKYLYTGGVRWHYYRHPEQEPLLGYREMTPVDTYEIGAYFNDEFDELMIGYLQSSKA